MFPLLKSEETVTFLSTGMGRNVGGRTSPLSLQVSLPLGSGEILSHFNKLTDGALHESVVVYG